MTWQELKGNKRGLEDLVRRYGGYAPAARAIGVPYATLRDECYRLGIPSPNVPGQRASSTARTVSLEAPPPRVRVERDGDAEVFIIDGVSYRIDRELKRRIYELYSSEGAGATLAEVEMETGIPRTALEAIKGYWGLVAAHWAAERLRGWEGVSVHVDERPMTSIVRGRNQFIALHGDRLRGGRTTRELDILQAIMMLGQPGYRHYVTFGHLHHREALNALLKESTGYEWYLLPSMVGGDEYSETLFATSRPAQMALLVDDELGVLAPWTIYVDTPEIQEGISA